MSDIKRNLTVEERLEALELLVLGIRGDLEGIRLWIKSEHDHFIHLNGSQDRIVDKVIDRLDLIEDRLEPTFRKIFPDYGKCLDAFDAIIEAPRKR